MIKAVIILGLLILLAPVIYLAGFGFYYGLDVGNGLRTIFLGYTGQTDYLISTVPIIQKDAVPTVKKEVIWLGDIENIDLKEASGVAESTRSEGVIYSINDSGNSPRLYAMDMAGGDLGSWKLDFREQHDLEDMSAFEYEGESYLLIADTGAGPQTWRRNCAGHCR